MRDGQNPIANFLGFFFFVYIYRYVQIISSIISSFQEWLKSNFNIFFEVLNLDTNKYFLLLYSEPVDGFSVVWAKKNLVTFEKEKRIFFSCYAWIVEWFPILWAYIASGYFSDYCANCKNTSKFIRITAYIFYFLQKLLLIICIENYHLKWFWNI